MNGLKVIAGRIVEEASRRIVIVCQYGFSLPLYPPLSKNSRKVGFVISKINVNFDPLK